MTRLESLLLYTWMRTGPLPLPAWEEAVLWYLLHERRS